MNQTIVDDRTIDRLANLASVAREVADNEKIKMSARTRRRLEILAAAMKEVLKRLESTV